MPIAPSPLVSWGSLLLGVTGFDESAFASDPGDLHGTGWGDVTARRLRYALYWALYEGNVYRRIHKWAAALKEKFDLYPSIRTIYCPTYRQIEFWTGHIWGGTLDESAGDGVTKASALPIQVPESNVKADELREVISRIWSISYSGWQINKDLVPRLGSALGDVALMVVDDKARRIARIHIIHPRTIFTIDKDTNGYCKGYELEEMRVDPRADSKVPLARKLVRYVEKATRSGDRVIYQTYIDEGGSLRLYDWIDYPNDRVPRAGGEWKEEYGFIPFFHIQHRDMGLGWGWAEPHPSLSKTLELHDAASTLNDQIRKIVDPKFLFAGVRAPTASDGSTDLDARHPEPTEGDPKPERDRIGAMYADDPAAHADPLVAELDINAVKENVLSILAELERDHPELKADEAGPDASGVSRRIARERVEAMVAQRRVGYDNALVRAQMACISIGAMKQYPGFEAFTAESYFNGELDHTIGDRPVFTVDELDRIEERQGRANVLKTLTDAGMPLDVAAEQAGYPAEVVGGLQTVVRQRAMLEEEMAGEF